MEPFCYGAFLLWSLFTMEPFYSMILSYIPPRPSSGGQLIGLGLDENGKWSYSALLPRPLKEVIIDRPCPCCSAT